MMQEMERMNKNAQSKLKRTNGAADQGGRKAVDADGLEVGLRKNSEYFNPLMDLGRNPLDTDGVSEEYLKSSGTTDK